MKLVVDESISSAQFEQFRLWAARQDLHFVGHLRVKEHHPGIPDVEILHRLLNADTALLTTDRPFHNTVLSRGLRSYHIAGETITAKPLPDIRVQPDVGLRKDRELQASYAPPDNPFRSVLMPDTPGRLKKLATARRRIRNHFGGLDKLAEIAVTASWRPLGARCLIGVQMQVSAFNGLEAIRGSESYVVEDLASKDHPTAALCHALVLVVQLSLDSLQVTVYFDQDRISTPPVHADSPQSAGFVSAYEKLQGSFPRLTLVPVTKGRHLMALRSKLDQLAGSRSNEIQAGQLQLLMRKLTEA